MIGLDTSTLVAHELREHNLHQKVRAGIAEQLELKGRFALTLQVLSEFIHVVTDARRFDLPLPMREALTRADFWWNARETVSCHPNADTWAQSRDWLSQYHLGRKRILDTTPAAVYKQHGVTRIATNNPSDFALFQVFSFEPWAMA